VRHLTRRQWFFVLLVASVEKSASASVFIFLSPCFCLMPRDAPRQSAPFRRNPQQSANKVPPFTGKPGQQTVNFSSAFVITHLNFVIHPVVGNAYTGARLFGFIQFYSVNIVSVPAQTATLNKRKPNLVFSTSCAIIASLPSIGIAHILFGCADFVRGPGVSHRYCSF
jgi:hypothetical protein